MSKMSYAGCMRILVTGASGLVGSALCPSLEAAGHTVIRLSRSGPVSWDPAARRIDPAALEGVEAVVHLAGESVAGRWSAAKKERIRSSRVEGTTFLAEALASLPAPPKVLASASAIGFYGSRGDEQLTEASGPGTGFLADVAQEWEASTRAASEAGIRVVHVRTGIVLSRQGGALAAMLPAFRAGAAGPIGGGRQWWSWVGLPDLVAIYERALADEKLRGPLNAVAPEPATNAAFTKALGRVLRRPAFLPLPGAAVKLLMGEMGEEMLLASTRVLPRALADAGFAFRHGALDAALRAELGR